MRRTPRQGSATADRAIRPRRRGRRAAGCTVDDPRVPRASRQPHLAAVLVDRPRDAVWHSATHGFAADLTRRFPWGYGPGAFNGGGKHVRGRAHGRAGRRAVLVGLPPDGDRVADHRVGGPAYGYDIGLDGRRPAGDRVP